MPGDLSALPPGTTQTHTQTKVILAWRAHKYRLYARSWRHICEDYSGLPSLDCFSTPINTPGRLFFILGGHNFADYGLFRLMSAPHIYNVMSPGNPNTFSNGCLLKECIKVSPASSLIKLPFCDKKIGGSLTSVYI